MARNHERLGELRYQEAAWDMPPGVSDTPPLSEVDLSDTTQFSANAEPQVDQITRDVLGIFDEGQAKANGPKLRYDLLDVG